MYNKNYLTKRPFVVITNHYKPAKGAQTQKPGWSDTAGWEIHEEMTVVDRVTNKHQSFATVIIDVMEATVVRNRFPDTNKDDILAHFMNKYKPQITEAITIWMERKAKSKALDELASPTEDTYRPAD